MLTMKNNSNKTDRQNNIAKTFVSILTFSTIFFLGIVTSSIVNFIRVENPVLGIFGLVVVGILLLSLIVVSAKQKMLKTIFIMLTSCILGGYLVATVL